MKACGWVVLLSSAAWGLAPAGWAQTSSSGTGFTITVTPAPAVPATPALPASRPPAAKVAATPPAARSVLVGKAGVPVAQAARAPAAAPAPLTSLSGVEERVAEVQDLEAQTPWVPARKAGEWFGTGMVDATFGGIGALRFDRGRVAGYVEGTTRSGVGVVASADTRELPLDALFSDLGARDPDRVLNRMRTEQNYLTHGDDSVSREGAPTSGKLYARVSKGDTQVLWGDFRASHDAYGLARSDRTLYGAQVVHTGKTVQAQAWAAAPDRVSRRDVLRATGGAVYTLSRADAFPGTEKVMVRVVDDFTGRVVSSQVLQPGQDYRFNAFQGALFLTQPLLDAPQSGGLRRELVVVYEHAARAGDPDGQVVGGRVVADVAPGVSMGVAANQEESAGTRHRVVGADMRVEGRAGHATFEAAHSRGPRLGATGADLGGWAQGTMEETGDARSSGTSWRVQVQADAAGVLGAGAQVELRHEETTAGFAGADGYASADERDTGVAVSVRAAGGEARVEASEFASDDGRRERSYALFYVKDLGVQGVVEAGLGQLERRDPQDAENTGRRREVALRWKRGLGAGVEGWIFGKATLDRSGGIVADNRLGAGVRAPLGGGWTIGAEASGGNLGPAGALEIARTRDGTERAFGYTRQAVDPALPGDEEGEGYVYTRLRQRVSDSLALRAEGRDYMTGQELGHASAVGVDWAKSGWTVDVTATVGRFEGRDGAQVDRRGVSLGAAFAGQGPHQGALRAEWRQDRSADADKEGRVVAATGTYSYTISPSWRALASLEFIEASGGPSFDSGRYAQVDVGAAWRGTESDRWTALFLASRLEDVPGPGVEREYGDSARKKATVVSLDLTHKPARRWTLGGKAAYRWMESGEDAWVRSDSGLVVARVEYEIDQRWDVSVDLRQQVFAQSGATRSGATSGVWRTVSPNARVGVGYHWGAVHDDLRNLDAPESGLFVNLTAAF